MLRITRQADYALVLLTRFARAGEGAVHAARELAEHSGLPLPTVSKILKSLSRAHLLSSLRGVNGGYRLARAAEAISVAEVIGAIDGPIAFTSCLSEAESGDACAIQTSCPTHAHWSRINRVVADALAGLTLADIARPPAPLPIGHVEAGRAGTTPAAAPRPEGPRP
jgi:FeS assembly SUF system regulator